MPKVEMVKFDAIIDVKIGSKFLQDLQQVLMYLSSLQPAGRMQQVVEKAGKDESSLDDWEKAVFTMLVMVTQTEENARAAGLTTVQEVPESEQSPESPE